MERNQYVPYKNWRSKHPFLDENYANTLGKPTQVSRGLFKGYSLPIWNGSANLYEELSFKMRVPHSWNGITNPWFVAITSTLNVEAVDDRYRFQMEWQSKDIEHVIPDTIQETITDEVTIVDGTAYYAEIIQFEVDASTIIAGQNIQWRLRRIAATQDEITNEIGVWHWDTRWKVNKFGTQSIMGY